MRALLVSGGGRFVDPWHPFAETSAALAAILEEQGYRVEIGVDADVDLAGLSEGPRPDLLALNIGWHGPERFADAATDGLVSALNAGLPTLLVHSTLTAFPAWPLWREIAGGGWIRGTTFHPDYGPGVALAQPDHPITAGLDHQLAITDERYTQMWVDDSSTVFLQHEEDGSTHALGWTRRWGGSPIVVDALGHDVNSYRDESRTTLLARELDWLQSSLTDGS